MKTDADDLVDYNPIAQQATGLTKREYFAAMAMQGILSSPKIDLTKGDKLMEVSIDVADALINALNQPK